MSGNERIRLTELASRGGCAAKWNPGDLRRILQDISDAQAMPPEAIQGFDTSDDAAVWRIAPGIAGVLTVDFFTPIVDDPRDFGRIAAANALSDIFAMGAVPHVALNLVAMDSTLPDYVTREVLRGGLEKVTEAGAVVMGGHSIDDKEPKYGLCVFGTVAPDALVRNEGAKPGDALYLTKPLGTGIASAGRRVGAIDDAAFAPVVESMAELNRAASEAMLAAGAHAATDVTGFGLAGHLHEMLSASGCAAEIDWAAVPVFAGIVDLARQWCRPSRSFALEDFAQPFLQVSTGQAGEDAAAVLCDPQTSGGLLCAIPVERASEFEREFETRCGRLPARIGSVAAGEAGSIRVFG